MKEKSLSQSIDKVKKHILSRSIYYGSNLLAVRSDKTLIRITRMAEKLVGKDYYVREIQRIRRMFESNHPTMTIARNILRKTNPRQRKKLIDCFIINQLLIGTNKRKDFSETPGGFYPPGFFVLSPTMNCNLHCVGCYSSGYKKDKGLSFEVMDDVLTQAKEMGMYFCVVSGGEPFLNPHLTDIFEKHNDVAFHVFTNGTLLDERTLERLVKVGNVLPAISIEGYEDFTDKRRGKGHYKRVMKAMRLCREAGFLFGFSVTYTRENAQTTTSDDFVDFLVNQGCILGWYFCYVPVGKQPDPDLMPTPEQRDHLRERIQYFRDTKPLLFGDFWNDGPVVGGCIAGGRKYFHINSRGDVEPCVFFQYSTHNIKDSTLKTALNSPFFQKIREGQRNNPNLLTPCTLIDKPEISRSAIACCGAKPSHPEATKLWEDYAGLIDEYSNCWCAIADKVWAMHPKNKNRNLKSLDEQKDDEKESAYSSAK